MIFKRNRVTFAPDEGAGGGATAPVVPGDGVGGGGDQGAATGSKPPAGWVAALTDEQKGNEWIKSFTKAPEFADAALKLKADHEALLPKLEGAIFKPGENATDADRAAYRKALGVPESPDEYEFPKGEGVEHDEKMISWAREVFHGANLSTEQAATISQAWDGFVQGLEQAQTEAMEQGVKEADEALKTEWKTDYDKNIEETRRGYQAFEKSVPGFADFLALATDGGINVGNHPMMLKAFHAIGRAIGDDNTLFGGRPAGETKKPGGFQDLYKTPNPTA